MIQHLGAPVREERPARESLPRTYLYYTDDQKRWADPITVTVLPAR